MYSDFFFNTWLECRIGRIMLRMPDSQFQQQHNIIYFLFYFKTDSCWRHFARKQETKPGHTQKQTEQNVCIDLFSSREQQESQANLPCHLSSC
jgi:hypothetical protein